MDVEICDVCDLEEVDCECHMSGQGVDRDGFPYDVEYDTWAELQQELYEMYRNEY